MLKNILNLNGAQELNKNEQKSITGGGCECFYVCTVCGFTRGLNGICDCP